MIRAENPLSLQNWNGMRKTMGLVIASCMVLAALASACAPEPQSTPESVQQSETLVQRITPEQMTQVATVRPSESAPVPDDSDRLGAAARTGCQATTDDVSAQYVLDATLDWMSHTLRVEQHVTFENDTGTPLDIIVFNVEPNREPGYFELQQLISAGANVEDYDLAGAQLVVPLEEPLLEECVIDVTLHYTLSLRAIANGYQQGHLGYLGYSARQVNLGMWFPLLAAYESPRQWLSPSFHSVGEHHVLRMGDYDLTLRVKNAPNGVRVAAPGNVEQVDDHTWQIELDNARELTVSLSDAFNTLTTVTGSGVEVVLYYFYNGVSESLDAPRHALYVAADALALFEELYGAYPYKRMVVVAGDFPDGMEFSGLVFVSEAWFRAWTGVPNDWLTVITAHEIAHQWWYNTVGNDQGRDPYLDEALASYSELLFFEHYYPDHVTWWWDFRVNAYAPVGHVDASVYEFASVRPYINAVYLRGALMIHSVRDALGDDPFFEWLKEYVAHMAGHVAVPHDFWGLLSTENYALTSGIRQTYFQHEDVLMLNDSIP